jgi:hypothetical protein
MDTGRVEPRRICSKHGATLPPVVVARRERCRWNWRSAGKKGPRSLGSSSLTNRSFVRLSALHLSIDAEQSEALIETLQRGLEAERA